MESQTVEEIKPNISIAETKIRENNNPIEKEQVDATNTQNETNEAPRPTQFIIKQTKNQNEINKIQDTYEKTIASEQTKHMLTNTKIDDVAHSHKSSEDFIEIHKPLQEIVVTQHKQSNPANYSMQIKLQETTKESNDFNEYSHKKVNEVMITQISKKAMPSQKTTDTDQIRNINHSQMVKANTENKTNPIEAKAIKSAYKLLNSQNNNKIITLQRQMHDHSNQEEISKDTEYENSLRDAQIQVANVQCQTDYVFNSLMYTHGICIISTIYGENQKLLRIKMQEIS